MILVLDTEKTYGSRNEDIAKKNKYTNVQITVNFEDDSQSSEPYSVITHNLDQSNSEILRLLAYKSRETSGLFPMYVADIYYKTYMFTINLNDPLYASLGTPNIPSSHNFTFDGLRYKEINNQTVLLSNINSFEDIVSYWEQKNISKNMFQSSITYEEQNFYNNIYTKKDEQDDDEEFNVMSEISETIQSAVDNANADFSRLNNYLNPEIVRWDVNGEVLTIGVKSPSLLKIFVDEDMQADFNYNRAYFTKPVYYQYDFTKISINFYEISTTRETMNFYEGNRTYSASDSFLFMNTNKVNNKENFPQNFATNIYEKYKNGKLKLDLKYPVTEIFDKFGNQVLYNEDFGFIRNIEGKYFNEDGKEIEVVEQSRISTLCPIIEGIVCNIRQNGEPVYFNPDGSEKYFLTLHSNLVYSGILLNELTLIETTEVLPEYTLSTNKTNVVTRISSPIAGAKSRVLKNGDKIYEGDELKISTTNDIREYNITNAGKIVSSGSGIYGGGTVNVIVEGDVNVSMTYMDWHWVDKNNYLEIEFPEIVEGQYGSYETFEVGYGGLKGAEENLKIYDVKFYEHFYSTTEDYEHTYEIIQNGIEGSTYEWNESIINGFDASTIDGFEGEVQIGQSSGPDYFSVSCSKDNTLTIVRETHMNELGYNPPNYYFTKIIINVHQYEYN